MIGVGVSSRCRRPAKNWLRVIEDERMQALLSSVRAAFKFLALSVKRWPSIWRAGLNSLATIWKRTLIYKGWVAAASHSLPTH